MRPPPPLEATFAWLDEVPLGFALAARNGVTVWLNRLALEMLGPEGHIDTEMFGRALAGEGSARELDLGDRVFAVTASPVPDHVLFTYRDITAERANPLPRVVKSSLPSAAARVLVVEDNRVNQLVAVGQLQRLGHECAVAASGAEAIEAVARERFDIVLMDVQMPDIDGYEVTRRIRSMPPPANAISIIGVTAHAIAGQRERCMAAGMNDYLAKPVSLEQLGAIVRLWTGGPDPETAGSTAQELIGRDDQYVLDRARVSTFLAMNRTQEGFLDGLVKVFRMDVPLRIAALRAAAAAGNLEGLFLAAHAMKSSSGSVGAKRMLAMASSLEEAARAGRLEGAEASIDQLAVEFGRVVTAYDGIIRRSSGKFRPA